MHLAPVSVKSAKDVPKTNLQGYSSASLSVAVSTRGINQPQSGTENTYRMSEQNFHLGSEGLATHRLSIDL